MRQVLPLVLRRSSPECRQRRQSQPASCITSRRILHTPSIPRHRLVLRIQNPSRCAQRCERRLSGVCVILIRVRRTHTRRWARRALHSRDGRAFSQESYATFGSIVPCPEATMMRPPHSKREKLRSRLSEIFYCNPFRTSGSRIDLDANTCLCVHPIIHYGELSPFSSQSDQRLGHIFSSEQ